MNDKARQHILAIFIIILLIVGVFSPFYGFPVQHADAAVIYLNDWLGVGSDNLTAYCGEHATGLLSDALDGTDAWKDPTNETHWFILDLGNIYNITQFRGRSERTEDPIDITIYVSEDNATWGTPVISNISTWQDTASWVKADSEDKDGRYIKLLVIDTEDITAPDFHSMQWGNEATPFEIFDVLSGIEPNYAPTQTSQKIWNSTLSTEWELNAIDVSILPSGFNVTIGDVDADNMNITIMDYTNGWKIVNQTSGSGLSNGTYSFTNTSWIDDYYTTYYVTFNVTDGVHWTNESYNFRTISNYPPTVIINFAGNLSGIGGPYYRPPSISVPLAGIWSDGYYTNDSYQKEGYIYIHSTITDTQGVDEVWLHWLNGTTWINDSYEFVNTGGNYYEFNTSGNITTGEGYNYSFDIFANDTGIGHNATNYTWSKIGVGATSTRRYVQLNCTPINITYSPLYLYDETYAGLLQKDTLRHDQGTDLGYNDTGYLRSTLPTDTVDRRDCGSYLGFWYDNESCPIPFELNNFYVHIWWSTDNDEMDKIGWERTREELVAAMTDNVNWQDTDNVSTIYYDDFVDATDNNYSLCTEKIDITSTSFTDNDVYEFVFKLMDSAGFPSVISNRSFNSFILFDLPDNATLNTSYTDSDSDGLSDWDELYTTFTNPFLADTDNDGVTDYYESLSGSDPNNYTETYQYSSPTGIHSMPRVNPSGVIDIFNTSANATMTITNGYNSSYGVWYGTTFPVNEENMAGNVSNTEIEYDQENSTLNAYITGLTPSQLYYTTAWIGNPSGFYNSSYYNYSFDNYSYVVNGSGWHSITFPDSIWNNNQQVIDSTDGNNYITVETFLAIGGIWDDVSLIVEIPSYHNWVKGAGGNTLTNLTYNQEYYFKFLNATNISFVFDIAGSYWYNITFPQEIFDYNSSLNVNNTCENFCIQGGIWDDVDLIVRVGDWKNWEKGHVGNTLTTISSQYSYWFKLLNYTSNLNFTYDKPNSNSTFLTRPNPPKNLTVKFSADNANLSWERNTSANTTIITVKIASSPTSPSDGTIIYNGTGQQYTDTYEDYTSRFYKAWSFTNWSYNPTLWQISSGNSSANTTYTIDPPYDDVMDYNYPYLNLSWSRGDRSIQEVVVSRNDTWATSVNQSGNWIRQNSTNIYYNTSETEMRYYTIWSYNNTDNIYSVIGLNILWGALSMQCHDENNNTGLTFDVLITNNALETLNLWDLTNPYHIGMNDIPYGDNTIFYVSSDNYESRTYYYDLALNHFYDLVFYLPLAIPPGAGEGGGDDPSGYDPENNTYSHLYRFIVVNEIDQPIEDAKINVMRYINASDEWLNVSVLLTDANGQADVYLLAGQGILYKINIVKEGYVTQTTDFIPDPNYFGVYYPKTFRLIREAIEQPVIITGYDIVTWDAYFLADDNTTLYIDYSDSTGNTTDGNIKIYQNGTNLTYTYNVISSSFSITWTEGNHSLYDYEVVLSIINHPDITDNNFTDIRIIERFYTPDEAMFDFSWSLELDFVDVLGENPLGWLNLIIGFLGIMMLVSVGKQWAGLGIIGLGALLFVVQRIIGLPGFTLIQLSVIPFFLLYGFLVIIARNKKEVRF